ncbi:MAG: UbiA family prenyltransferase [Phycisphaera sp.]|nr:MAG: UbiA family prenyltransferase [Phycisphaera sp.]
MTEAPDHANTSSDSIGTAGVRREPLWTALLRLARPKQWAKSVFVAVGPFFGGATAIDEIWGVVLAMAAFALASSGCYVVNDLRDTEADRLHPRKRRRPIASGRITASTARLYAISLWIAAAACVAALGPILGSTNALALGGLLALYILNVTTYSLKLKGVPVLDVLSLALGFVLRVLGGCAAVGITPSTWLLNVTLFLAMFLAFGKRLGERRTLGGDATAARAVQGVYTDELLRMMVVVTAVAMLLTYAGYVQDNESRFVWIFGGRSLGMGDSPRLGMNLLWLTMLPATFAVLRCIILLERGDYDDPTELATRDRDFQLAALVFGTLTAVLVLWAGPAERPHPDSPPGITDSMQESDYSMADEEPERFSAVQLGGRPVG